MPFSDERIWGDRANSSVHFDGVPVAVTQLSDFGRCLTDAQPVVPIRDSAGRASTFEWQCELDNSALAAKMILDELAAVNVILGAKATSEEADAFRHWLLDVAGAAADAAKEGGFMGFGAVQVSEGEKRMIDELRTALGMPQA